MTEEKSECDKCASDSGGYCECWEESTIVFRNGSIVRLTGDGERITSHMPIDLGETPADGER